MQSTKKQRPHSTTLNNAALVGIHLHIGWTQCEFSGCSLSGDQVSTIVHIIIYPKMSGAYEIVCCGRPGRQFY